LKKSVGVSKNVEATTIDGLKAAKQDGLVAKNTKNLAISNLQILFQHL
jgi:hypothetical protein